MHWPLIQNKKEGDDRLSWCTLSKGDGRLIQCPHRAYWIPIQHEEVDERLMQHTHRAYQPPIQHGEVDDRLIWCAHRAY
eukprot:7049700-Ditylum_brightwellii.AAC.1